MSVAMSCADPSWLAGASVALGPEVHAASTIVVVTASMAAYALARMEFRGKKLMTGLIISTLFVPPIIFLMPTYLILDKLQWLDSLLATRDQGGQWRVAQNISKNSPTWPEKTRSFVAHRRQGICANPRSRVGVSARTTASSAHRRLPMLADRWRRAAASDCSATAA